MTYITIDDIAGMIGVSRKYVRETLIHSADFPRPALVLSERIKRWKLAAIEAWLVAHERKWAR